MANKENIRKWVDALRSGEFKQGTGRLRTGDSYCCLGVACEIAKREGVDLRTATSVRMVNDDEGSTETIHYYDDQSGYPPTAVGDWLGVGRRNPHVGVANGVDLSATEANDTHLWDFAKIADGIENLYLAEDKELVPA